VNAFRVEYPCSASGAADALLWATELGGKTLVIGGGTLAVPMLSQGIMRPTHVIDLGRVGADKIEVSSARIRIGSMVSYQQLITTAAVAHHMPLLHRMATGITGGIQIRNQGTLGGAACAARPQSDAPAVLVGLGAQMTLLSQRGTRVVPAHEFFQGAERTALAPDELLLDMTFPLAPIADRPAGYYKLKFAESSWPVVTAACLLSLEASDIRRSIDIVIGGVSDVPLSLHLQNTSFGNPDRELITHAVSRRIQALAPDRRWSDIRAGADYRAHVAGEIAYRAVQLAQDTKGKAA
jgi:carbon-monoxide dehydrogenase medium subunit